MEFKHVSVLYEPVIELLNVKADGTYLDGTLKGNGRYYRGSEIYRSASAWSSNICIIEHP